MSYRVRRLIANFLQHELDCTVFMPHVENVIHEIDILERQLVEILSRSSSHVFITIWSSVVVPKAKCRATSELRKLEHFAVWSRASHARRMLTSAVRILDCVNTICIEEQ